MMYFKQLTVLLWIVLLHTINAIIYECKDVTELISHLNGERLVPSRDMTITSCNTSAIIQNQPINLESYQEYIKFYKNRDLQKIYANTFSRLPNVKTLIISEVGLSTLEPGALKGLNNLLYLNLRRNKIQTLPETVFDDTPNLIELDLEENKLNLIPDEQFSKLTNLKKLNLANNEISYLPNPWCQAFRNLEYLTLSNNELTTLTSGMFQGLSRLETLRINNNAITVLQPGCFSSLTSLKSLSLHYNGLLKSENLLNELGTLNSLNGLTISPPNLECGILQQIMDWSNVKNIEIVQIPAVVSCWEH